MTATPHRTPLGRVYGWLLLAYPPAFRRRHGVDMVRVFEDELRHLWPGRGPRAAWPSARVLLGAASDVLRSAPPAWLAGLREILSRAPAAGEEPHVTEASASPASGPICATPCAGCDDSQASRPPRS